MPLLYIIRAYSGFCLKIEHYVSSSNSHFAFTLQFVVMLNSHEPSWYVKLLSILEFVSCREIFICTRWGVFLSSLQGHDDVLSLQFALNFDGKTAHIRSLTFPISEESISISKKLPRLGDWWLKSYKLSHQAYDHVFKQEYQNISGAKGYSKGWIRDKLLSPLVIITWLITCEVKYSTFKTFHFHILTHFHSDKPLNFPFFFWKSLEKISSHTRKNMENPSHILLHHGIIKLLIVLEIQNKNWTWEDFLYEFLNPHLMIWAVKREVDFKINPHSFPCPPKSKNPPTNPIPLVIKNPKKSIFTLEDDKPTTHFQPSSNSTTSKKQRM